MPAHPAEDAGFRSLLGCEDPVMAALVASIGPLEQAAHRRGRPDDAYGTLVRTIVGQQLSTKAARTIYARLVALFGDNPPTPSELLAAEEAALRAAGLSRQKNFGGKCPIRATEKIIYYALRETDEPEATGLFRVRLIPGVAMHLEHIDRSGRWVRNNDLLRYLAGYDTGAEKVSGVEAAMIARRLGSSIRRTA